MTAPHQLSYSAWLWNGLCVCICKPAQRLNPAVFALDSQQCWCSAELQALQCSLTSEQIAAKTAELQHQVPPSVLTHTLIPGISSRSTRCRDLAELTKMLPGHFVRRGKVKTAQVKECMCSCKELRQGCRRCGAGAR